LARAIQAQGFGVAAYTGGPSVGAAGYRHRATLEGAKMCMKCNANRLGQKYGTAARKQAQTSAGYIKVDDWGPFFGYSGIHPHNQGLRHS